VLQQHINRSQRRMARMNRRAGLSDEELKANLVKRISSLSEVNLSKRSESAADKRDNESNEAISIPPTANNSLGLDIE